MGDKLIYGVYARVSTHTQNINQQVDLLKQYAKRNNLNIRTYKDFDVSSKIPIHQRPTGKKLIKDIEKGYIKGLIVQKYDRVTRNLKHALDFLDFWKLNQFKFISLYDGEFIGTPDNIFSFKLKCLLSEYELDQLHYRRKIGIERAKKDPTKYKGRPKGSKNKKK